MLIRFFIKHLLQQFVLCFALLMLLLAASNLFVRLPGIISIQIIPIIFIVMLPLVALFALPLASSLALQTVVGNLFVHDELLFLSFTRNARTALYKAVVLFTLIIMSVYVPLVLFWAPASYSRGKQMLVSYAYEQLTHLEAKVFHGVVDGVSVYFTDKRCENDQTLFYNIFLVLTSKNCERYFFTARQGELSRDAFLLKQGSLLFIKSDRCYSAQFASVQIDAAQLWNLEQGDTPVREVKFKLFPQLLSEKINDHSSFIEFHKRLALLLWQLLLPFIALFLIMIMGQRKSNMLRSIIMSGFLFFMQYTTLTFAHALQHWTVLALLFFYLPPLIIFSFGMYKAHRF